MEHYLEEEDLCDLNIIKNIEDTVNQYIEVNISDESLFQELLSLIRNANIVENKHKFNLFLHLISKISNNYHRSHNFFIKIEKILNSFSADIKRTFSNQEIFNIFKNNKRIILFLFSTGIIIPSIMICQIISNGKYKQNLYPQYFYPEFKSYYSYMFEYNFRNDDDFEKNKQIGENHNYICKLIRNDDIIEFISYVNKFNYPLTSKIQPSIYETNTFLLKNQPSLIEYAVFYGSIQIFRYLKYNSVELTSIVMMLAVEKGNIKIIKLLLSIPNIDINMPRLSDIVIYKDESEFNGYEGETALNSAIKNENIEIIKILLSRKDINVNLKSIYINSGIHELAPLHIAIEKGNIKILKMLLSHQNIDVNIIELSNVFTKYYESIYIENAPIHIAIEQQNIEILNILLSHPNININARSCLIIMNGLTNQKYERNALSLAISNKDIEITKHLLQFPKLEVNTLLSYECKKIILYDKKDIKNINKAWKDIIMTRETKTPLFIAVEKKYLAVIQLLISRPEIDKKFKSKCISDRTYFCYNDIKGVKYESSDNSYSISDLASGNNDIIKLLEK